MRIRKDYRGSVAGVLMVVLLVLLLVGALGAFGWAFSSRQTYKNSADKLIASAVDTARKQQQTLDTADFAEKEKVPNTVFTGPAEIGAVKLVYPKTWSVYADMKTSNTSKPVDFYAYPGYVPGLSDDVSYALRFQILDQQYADAVNTFQGDIKAGKISATAYRPSMVGSVLGVKLVGALTTKHNGTMVILPLRDKTIKIWTESNTYAADFDNVLTNLTFLP